MRHHESRWWMRHTAAVPKGYLKRYILLLLSEKPMSGAEIMEEIGRDSQEERRLLEAQPLISIPSPGLATGQRIHYGIPKNT